MQRARALAITGGLQTSPMDTLNACTFLLPAPLVIHKWCHREFIRMAMLPLDHPLFKPINWKRTRVTKRHHGPLQNLFRIYEMEATNYKQVLSVLCNPSLTGMSPFYISILADKESLVWELENTIEEIQVFLDSLVQGGKVGAVLRSNGLKT
jgi:hypothetical protein